MTADTFKFTGIRISAGPSFLIPRAMSVDSDDQRYRDDWPMIGPHLVIAVDGIVRTHVMTYDMDEGYVLRAATDEDGRVLVDDGLVRMEHLHGVVTVTTKKPDTVFMGLDLSSKPDMTNAYELARDQADQRIESIRKSIKLGARRTENRFKL